MAVLTTSIYHPWEVLAIPIAQEKEKTNWRGGGKAVFIHRWHGYLWRKTKTDGVYKNATRISEFSDVKHKFNI